MPTGYTAAVGDGKVSDFPTFAMNCARAFGALITMRDAPADAEIPDEFPVDEYPMRRHIEAQERLNDLRRVDDAEARFQAQRAYDKALTEYRRAQRDQAATRANYEAMLDKVRAWTPPTPDHDEMKTFMIQQLEESIRFDCGFEMAAPTRKTGPEWLADQIAQAERDVEYYATEHEKAVNRAEGRTAWVRALRESLGTNTSTVPA